MPGFLEATVEIDGGRVRVFTTHLDYRADPRVRNLQVAATIARLDAIDGPMILMGDLNAPPHAVELAPSSSGCATRGQTDPTPDFTYPAIAPVRRIDYILASGDLRARNVRVPPIEASDHRPVVADISPSP